MELTKFIKEFVNKENYFSSGFVYKKKFKMANIISVSNAIFRKGACNLGAYQFDHVQAAQKPTTII